jgi:hypothetical protein
MPKRAKTNAWPLGSGWGDDDSWGSPAQPYSCTCVCAKAPENTPKNVEDDSHTSDEEESPAEQFDGVVERKEHYLVREQIWHVVFLRLCMY